MNTYRRLLFIINPHAGIQRKDSSLSEIILTFSDYDYESIVCFTRKSGDATQLVLEHADDDISLIVCMGGDGTLNEVIAGCRSVGWDKPIGYIPAGSTNDFAQTLSLPSDPVEAAQRIMNGKPKRHDIGEFNGRTFVYTASTGLFTKASYETPQKVKNVFGHFAYILSGIKDLTQVHPYHMRILTEGKVYEDNYLFVSVCNSLSIGGIMNFGSDVVDLQDGFFEVLLVSNPHDLNQLRIILQALTEQRFDLTPLVRFFRTDHAIISCQEKPDWTLDGEHGEGRAQNEISVISGGIRIVY